MILMIGFPPMCPGMLQFLNYAYNILGQGDEMFSKYCGGDCNTLDHKKNLVHFLVHTGNCVAFI